jgi:ketosteroid isomerase-like protein
MSGSALAALDLGVAQSKAGPSSKILALESKWNEAYKHGDVATMESLLADDFVITVEDGSTFSKSGYIAHNADCALHPEISDMAEIKVRMHGNVAVVTAAYHEKGTSKGNLYESRPCHRCLDEKRGRRVASHRGPSIPARQ